MKSIGTSVISGGSVGAIGIRRMPESLKSRNALSIQLQSSLMTNRSIGSNRISPSAPYTRAAFAFSTIRWGGALESLVNRKT